MNLAQVSYDIVSGMMTPLCLNKLAGIVCTPEATALWGILFCCSAKLDDQPELQNSSM